MVCFLDAGCYHPIAQSGLLLDYLCYVLFLSMSLLVQKLLSLLIVLKIAAFNEFVVFVFNYEMSYLLLLL